MKQMDGTKFKDRLPVCKDGRRACLAYRGGKCAALMDTEFGKKKCPFYKTKAMARMGREYGEAALRNG